MKIALNLAAAYRTLFSILFLVTICFNTVAQVTPVGTPAFAKQSNTIASFTVPAGNKRMLLVTASDGSSINITGVAFNGMPMIKRQQVTDGFIAVDAIYTLSLGDGSSSITGSIVFTSAGGINTTRFISAAAFTNVNQAIPFSDMKSGLSNSSSSTLNITSSPGDLVFDIFDSWNNSAGGTQVQGAGQTIVNSSGALNFGSGAGYGFYSTSKKAGASTVTNSWVAAGHSAEIHIAVNISQDNIVLPVKLLSFNAVKKNNDVLLNWVTTGEINFNYSEVERSCNGTDFSFVGKSMKTDKGYTDVDAISTCPGDGVLFYRLKMVDDNGSFSYSPVVLVKKSETGSVVTGISSISSAGRIAVSFNMPQRDKVIVKLTSVSGQLMKTVHLNPEKGSSVQYIDGLNSLPAGIYALQVIYGGNVVTQKLIK
ncbi:hypothetical protein BH11BAC3_BH11BAC3_23680 [soil metagenome]